MCRGKFVLHAKVARIQALAISAGPIVCSYFYGKHRYGDLDFVTFLMVAASIVLFHLSVNTISEYRDFKKGIDDPACEWPKYRIVAGLVEPRHILLIGRAAFVLAASIGIAAMLRSTPILLIPGLLGASLVWFYSEWPIGYKYRGIGELGVFAGYGPLLVFSCVFSATRKFDFFDLLFSIPFGLLAVTILLANNIRDYKFDLQRTTTLTTALGLKASYIILFFITHLNFFFVPFLIQAQTLPFASFIVFCAYPIIFLSLKRIDQPRFINVFGAMNAAYCALLALSFLL